MIEHLSDMEQLAGGRHTAFLKFTVRNEASKRVMIAVAFDPAFFGNMGGYVVIVSAYNADSDAVPFDGYKLMCGTQYIGDIHNGMMNVKIKSLSVLNGKEALMSPSGRLVHLVPMGV